MISAPGSARASTTIGQTFTPTAVCTLNTTALQSTSPGAAYEAPTAGVLTSWSFQAPATQVPDLKLKVARRAGADSFTIVGESPLVASLAGTLNTFPVQIPVQAGDLIGLYTTNGGKCGNIGEAGYVQHYLLSEATLGSTQPFTRSDGVQYDVSANLETNTATGQRAAALKKCKRKHGKKRKKCKRKANRLPV